MAQQVEASRITTYWKCESKDCRKTAKQVEWPLIDIPHRGTPICPECGDDCTLLRYVIVEDDDKQF